CYKRYFDDSVCVIKRDEIDEFHKHLNDQDDNINFTIERYTDDGLPFLDTLNKVRDDGFIKLSIYGKKTHTGRYLDFNSHHPKVLLAHRSETLLVDDALKSKEQEHIKTCLSENGYPKRFINKHLQLKKKTTETTDEDKGLVVLPYVQNLSERISRILARYNIKTCMKPCQKLRGFLSKPKDPIDKGSQTGVVYSIPCHECVIKYIGETKRALKTREKEHQAALRLNHPDKSALAEHAMKTGHSINWLGSSVVYKEERWHQRKWLESQIAFEALRRMRQVKVYAHE
ncbi:uncharacterized protein LOC116292390, partial [Actinia tenebrosa]|uniref:Uncharacterized protein LOC116292390 n=1 Tax=Actinia tenebrosa TaxID=6105 RepID=A0A6P8HGM0_ACTTE